MTKEEKFRRAQELKELIKNLATSCITNEELPYYVEQLKNIYCVPAFDKNGAAMEEEYRHEYFRVSGTIYDIYSDESNESRSLEMLLYNLGGLLEFVEKQNIQTEEEKEFLKKLTKLNDHVNLEITRIVRSAKDYRGLNKLSTTVRDSVEKTNETLKKIEELKQSIDTSTTNQITILSIFTGIVMAFVGGFSILGSAFSNTELFQTRIWLLIFLMSLVGFIFFNTVFMFIYMVAKLSGKRLSVQCKTQQCGMCMKCEECKKFKILCPFHKLGKKYPYVAYINIILLVMIVATGIYGFHSSICSQRTVPVNVVVEDQLSQTEQSLPSDIDFDVQLTNECNYGKTELEKGAKTNPYTGK